MVHGLLSRSIDKDNPVVISRASFDSTRVFRYSLHRIWDESSEKCVFIGLNPSTADESVDDPTIRRCIQFARDFGCSSVHMVNLFAYRATQPKEMKLAADPVGPDNDEYLLDNCAGAKHVIAAWGVHGAFRGRDKVVLKLLLEHDIKIECLRITKAGHPSHPLYLSKELVPIPYCVTR